MTALAFDVTGLLLQWDRNDPVSQQRLLSVIYKELHRLARGRLRRERGSHTLQPTALVHEAYLRLIRQEETQWKSRAQFLAISSEIMRRVLLDYARKRCAQKRGPTCITLDEGRFHKDRSPEVDLAALDDALQSLALLDSRQARVVELRYFGGLTVEEICDVLNISPATVKRDWSTAKAWLFQQLRKG